MTTEQFPYDMRALGWSDQRLANKLGTTRQTVRKWRLGISPVPPEVARFVRECCLALAHVRPPERAAKWSGVWN